MKAQRGFTLLEVLVAVAIFAILGLAAYAGLDAVLKARARLDDENRQWRAVALLWVRLGRDLEAQVERPARVRGSPPQPAFLGQPTLEGAYAAHLELTRLAPQDTGPAPPERVAWRLRDGRVEWLRWPALDSGPGAVPDVAVLLRGATALEFAYRDGAGVWSDRWPAKNQSGRPEAVRATLTLASGEVVSRLFVY